MNVHPLPAQSAALARYIRARLSEYPDKTPLHAELSFATGISEKNMSRALKLLEDKGHLDRSGPGWIIPPATCALLDALDGKPLTLSGDAGETGLKFISLSDMTASSLNPRKTFDPEKLHELAESIRAQGLLQPVLVRPAPEPGKFLITAGERRFRACALIVEQDDLSPDDFLIPARVMDMTDWQAIDAAISENLDRADVSPLEQAEGFAAALEARAAAGLPASAADLAEAYGKSPRYIQQWVSLARNGSEKLKTALTRGALTFDQCRAIVAHDAPVQNSVAQAALTMGRLRKSPDQINEDLKAQCAPVSRAIFPVDEYKGPCLRSAGKPTHFYDMPLFIAHQRAVFEGYKSSHDWVEAENDHEFELDYGATQDLENLDIIPRKRLVYLDETTGRVKILRWHMPDPAPEISPEPIVKKSLTVAISPPSAPEPGELVITDIADSATPEDAEETDPPTIDMFPLSSPGVEASKPGPSAKPKRVLLFPEFLWFDALDAGERAISDAIAPATNTESDRIHAFHRCAVSAITKHLVENGVWFGELSGKGGQP